MEATEFDTLRTSLPPVLQAGVDFAIELLAAVEKGNKNQ